MAEPASKTVFTYKSGFGGIAFTACRTPASTLHNVQTILEVCSGPPSAACRRPPGLALVVWCGARWAPPAQVDGLRRGPALTIICDLRTFFNPVRATADGTNKITFPRAPWGIPQRGEMPFPQHGFCTSRVPSSPPLRFGGAAPGLECPPGRKGLGAPGILVVARKPAEKSAFTQATDQIRGGRYIII